MAEHGREGSSESTETGALPEGAAIAARSAAPDLGVPLFRTQFDAPTSLDVLVQLDEPELLIKELKDIAKSQPAHDKRWIGIFRLCERAEEYFEVIHRPEANRPQR